MYHCLAFFYSQELKPGDRVLARWSDSKFYPAKVHSLVNESKIYMHTNQPESFKKFNSQESLCNQHCFVPGFVLSEEESGAIECLL